MSPNASFIAVPEMSRSRLSERLFVHACDSEGSTLALLRIALST